MKCIAKISIWWVFLTLPYLISFYTSQWIVTIWIISIIKISDTSTILNSYCSDLHIQILLKKSKKNIHTCSYLWLTFPAILFVVSVCLLSFHVHLKKKYSIIDNNKKKYRKTSTLAYNEKRIKNKRATHFSFCSVFLLLKSFINHMRHLYYLSHFMIIKKQHS